MVNFYTPEITNVFLWETKLQLSYVLLWLCVCDHMFTIKLKTTCKYVDTYSNISNVHRQCIFVKIPDLQHPIFFSTNISDLAVQRSVL